METSYNGLVLADSSYSAAFLVAVIRRIAILLLGYDFVRIRATERMRVVGQRRTIELSPNSGRS